MHKTLKILCSVQTNDPWCPIPLMKSQKILEDKQDGRCQGWGRGWGVRDYWDKEFQFGKEKVLEMEVR